MNLASYGCQSDAQLRASAAQTAVAQSPTVLPDLPLACHETVPHAALTVGEEISSILKRERRQLDVANGHIEACGQFYGSLRASLAKGHE